ncbi:MAG: molybdenum cofactor guanylyltransferase [Spirochaetales bacterium]|nr:molybdenum cofactor guanylyltransferase [Spirochaetales bacterium]MCF7938094.1 molybdenum cofactor guanylyltransferase [Spirochaetales bacterium]
MNAVILAGGRASRLEDTAKALLPLGGESLVTRKIRLLEPLLFNTIVVSVNEGMKDRFDKELAETGRNGTAVQVVEDPVSGSGPVMGLLAALSASDQEWNLVTTADTPFVSPVLLSFLSGQLDTGNGTFPSGLVASWKGLPEPLLGIYHRNCTHIIPQMSEDPKLPPHERLKVGTLVQRAGMHVLPAETIESIDPQGWSFFNINTREDYDRAGFIIEDRIPAGTGFL